MRVLLLVSTLLLSLLVYSQQEQMDSLRRRLENRRQADTTRVVDLNEMAWQWLDYSLDSSERYVWKALSLSRKLKYIHGTADAKNTLGVIRRLQNRPDEAIQLYEEVIVLRRKSKRTDKLTGAFSNLGSVYYENGNYAPALKYYQKAFDNAITYKQEENQLILLNNIGVAYKSSGLYEQALKAFRKGLRMNRKIRNSYQEAQLYLNIATIYDQRRMYHESVRYNKHAYAIFSADNNIRQLSTVVYNLTIATREIHDFDATRSYLKEMSDIAAELKEDDYTCIFHQSSANFFLETKRYKEALTEIEKALQLSDSSSDLLLYAKLLMVKSDVFRYLKLFPQAIDLAHQSEAIIQRMDDPLEHVSAYSNLYHIYKDAGNYEKALYYSEKEHALSEQIALDEVSNQIATLNSLNELDQKEQQIQLGKKEKAQVEAENKRQYVQLIASLVVAMLVLVLLLFSFRAYRMKKRSNEQLHLQKVEIESQKSLIEEKQSEILDSIHYAKRIQQALLAQEHLLKEALPESFLFFKPKDIVSGDFYWSAERGDYFYLAVCDSTGHGVPGAFMSLLNITFLNDAINSEGLLETDAIFNYVRQRLIHHISKDGARDGMDGVLLRFDRRNNSYTYSAALSKPVIVRNDEIIELSCDKMPVGQGEGQSPFSRFSIDHQPGDYLYLFSDGFADQFGGPNGKKFKYKPLYRTLSEGIQLSPEQQAKRLDTIFSEWKGELEQIDDVVMVGIRLA